MDEYTTPEIIPITIRDKLEELSRTSGVKIDVIVNAYRKLLSGIDRNQEGRFVSALQITTFQLQDYVKRNKIKPTHREEKDKHTPAQIRYAEHLYMKLLGQRKQG